MGYLQDVCNYTNAPEKEVCKKHSIFLTCTMLNIVSDINPFNYPLAYPASDANHKSSRKSC